MIWKMACDFHSAPLHVILHISKALRHMAAEVQENIQLPYMPEDVVAAAESKQTCQRQFFIIFAPTIQCVLSFSRVRTLIETLLQPPGKGKTGWNEEKQLKPQRQKATFCKRNHILGFLDPTFDPQFN